MPVLVDVEAEILGTAVLFVVGTDKGVEVGGGVPGEDRILSSDLAVEATGGAKSADFGIGEGVARIRPRPIKPIVLEAVIHRTA